MWHHDDLDHVVDDDDDDVDGDDHDKDDDAIDNDGDNKLFSCCIQGPERVPSPAQC